MEKDHTDSDIHSPSSLNNSDTDKSFVGKFKSHVSGIINNTPLSKWFRKNDDKSIRRRDDEQDEEIYQMQPPQKRAKLPSENDSNIYSNHFSEHISSTPLGNSVITKNNFTSFQEPVAGPSGIKSRKLLTNSTISARNTFNTNELLNGHKDSDSEESTSGYSSVARISSKEQVFESRDSSKQTSPLENSPTNSRSLFNQSNKMGSRSLFAESSLSPRANTSLSSRRPSFNASTFGSPNFVDKTVSTGRVLNSPFYSGRTTYGGASAYGRRLGRTAKDLRQSVKNSVQIKPVNRTRGESHVALGKTAQRILTTLEQYSSPVNDAKKIPMATKKMRAESGILTRYTGANPYLMREPKVASNSELQVPTVSDLLKMKQSRERLQESTESVRQLATSSKSSLNVENYKISTSESEKRQHTGKIRNKVSQVRQKVQQPQQEEPVQEVPLVPVALPITTLPKFDLKIPPPKPVVKKSDAKDPPFSFAPVEPKTDTLLDYRFSKPHVIAENLKSLVGINNYKFSEPLSKRKSSGPTSNFKMPEQKPFVPLAKTKNNGDSVVKAARELKTGSVLEILGRESYRKPPKPETADKLKPKSLAEKFQPSEGTWECSACQIRNQKDKTKCAACETPKAAPKPKVAALNFGSTFKMPADKWECSACLVRNAEADRACVACTTPRQPKTSLADKFKPAADTWECDACLIRNKSGAERCAACETPKPSAKAAPPTFNLKQTGWECGTCLVRNKSDASKCVACEAAKPGAVPNSFGDRFKIKDSEWECGVCLVKNSSANNKCQCCETPNAAAPSSSAASLQAMGEKKPIKSFNFGIDKGVTQTFNFGIPTAVAKAEAVASSSASGMAAASVFGEAAKPSPQQHAPASFSFGVPVAPAKPTEREPPPPAVATQPTKKTPQFAFASKKPEVVSGDAKPTPPPPAAFSFKPAAAAVNGDLSKPAAVFGTVKSDVAKPTTFAAPTAASNATTATTFSFGGKPAEANPLQTSWTAPKVANGFGTSAAPSFNSSNTPSFGTTANFTSESKPFSFGGAPNNTEAANKAPMFSFGQSAASASATASAPPKPGGFSFGQAPAAATVAAPSGGFSFAKNQAAAPNMFAAAAAPTVKNGTAFNFGSAPNNNNQKAGFSFGAAATNSGSSAVPTGAASAGFNFGAAATAAPTAGGFNFSAPAASFDANAKPTFNFTEGQQVVGFSAPPASDGSVGPRRIKKAVRRTTQR